MIQKSYILLAILLTNLLGQTFSGTIKDISGEPISYVIIEEINSKSENTNWTMSDENGDFTINVNSESDVFFKRIGFKSQTIKPNERLTKYVTMLFENISLETVDVYGRDNDEYLRNKTTYNNLGTYSRGGSLNQIPSLEMRTYGGYAGVTSASFDGGYARHTKVLYNGVDLTDAMNGQADLSTIPSFALKSINYKLNSGTKYGSGSIDGSLNINNNIKNNNVFYGIGDYGFSQFGANYSIDRTTSKRNIVFGKTSYNGDFKFKNANGDQIKRSNNYLDQFFLAMDRQFIVRDDLIVNIMTLKTENTRGLSGSTSFPSPNATRTDDFELFALSFNKFFDKGFLKVQMNRSSNDQVYDDSNASFPVFSEHNLDYTSFELKGKQSITKSLNYEALFNQKTERVDSSDLEKRELKTTSLSLTGNYVNLENDFKISPSLRFDSREENEKSTFNLGLEALNQLNQSNSSFDFNLDIGSSFQFPTMNDLFWPDGLYSGGNEELKPEESEYMAISISNLSSIGKIKLTASFKDYENLILWQPNESFKYIPINVSSAERTSYNLQYLKEFPRLQMQLTYNLYDSLDKDMDEKLLYVPDSSASLLLIFKQNNSASYSINYKLTGDRILQYGSDWANTVKDETFGLVSFGLSKNIAFGGNQNMVKANLTIDNLLDEVYISTIGYPEPGRSMNLTIEYQL
jgi:outer membrane cobalamin receptor